MKALLAKTLIERGIIQRGTILQAYHSARGLSGQYDAPLPALFKLVGAQAVGEWVYFDSVSPDGSACRIRCDYVTELDGMPIARVAESHLLTEDGESLPPKRGRRRKPQSVDGS